MNMYNEPMHFTHNNIMEHLSASLPLCLYNSMYDINVGMVNHVIQCTYVLKLQCMALWHQFHSYMHMHYVFHFNASVVLSDVSISIFTYTVRNKNLLTSSHLLSLSGPL